MITRASIRRAIHADWRNIKTRAIKRGASPALVGPVGLPKLPTLLGSSLKVEKGSKVEALTRILYLLPGSAIRGRRRNALTMCPWASAGCEASCLGHNSGMLSMSGPQAAQLWRTVLYLGAPDLFDALLRIEIRAHAARADRLGLRPAVRLNGTSDVVRSIDYARAFPDVQFYDYTKSMARWRAQHDAAPNYALHLSFSGENRADCVEVLSRGGNVAVAFDGPLPATWEGFPVIDGDETDARWLDPVGSVCGLKFKAAADRAGHLAAAGDFVEVSR